MRYDMHEVAIERPRRGMRYGYPRNTKRHARGRSFDELPAREGMGRPWKLYGECKEFSDLLGPLHGFLVSRVGRLWNDVYSEIRQRLNPASTVQIHILEHVRQFVDVNVFIGEDGKMRINGRFGMSHVGSGDVYVHPVTGILCREPDAPSWRHRKQTVPDDVVVVGDREMRRIDGTWYWVREVESTVPIVDGSTASFVNERTLEKRQVSRRDLRRHGVTNSIT